MKPILQQYISPDLLVLIDKELIKFDLMKIGKLHREFKHPLIDLLYDFQKLLSFKGWF